MMEAHDIVNKMMQADYFSQWLGIKVEDCRPGYCRISMTVRKDMLNGFGIAHGGISYSAADSALAFASNGKGPKSLSIETSIAHVSSLKENDHITAVAQCETESTRIGHYSVKVFLTSDPDEPVALFKGIVYKKMENW